MSEALKDSGIPGGPPKVIHGGPWRTGTASMAGAYRILGLRAHHTNDRFGDFKMWEVLEHAAEAKWPKVPGARRRPPMTKADWDTIFGEWDAITDGGSDFIEELAAAYPDAKIVIVERDFDKWWYSYETECVDRLFNTGPRIMGATIQALTGWRAFSSMQKVVLGSFGARNVKEVRERAREYYTSFYENIRRTIPPERILEYRLGSGWEPLCQFLGKDVPNVEFPRLNDAQAHGENVEAFKWIMLAAIWKTLQPWVLAATVAAAAGVWRYGFQNPE